MSWAPVEDPHQRAVGAHLDPGADQRAGHRVERPGDLDVMVTVHLRGRVDRDVVDLGGRRQQPWCLFGGEHLGGSLLGRAMDPQPGSFPAPHLGPSLRLGKIDEDLTGEERAADELHLPLHPRLVLRRTHPRRVDDEPAGLRVLHERLVQARLERIGAVDDRREVVGDQGAEHPTEERPCRLAPGHHRLGGLTVREPHEAVTADARREDQRVHHPVPVRRRIEHEAHATEVDLQLVARLTIVDPHRRPPATGAAQDLSHVALHRPARHLDAAAGQQLVDLHRGQVVFDPRRELVVIGLQQSPGLAVAVDAVRTDRFDHHPDERVAQQLVPAVAHQPQPDRGIHVATNGLAVEPDQPLRRPDALAGQPQPQHLSNLEHSDLPERHRRLRLAEQDGGNSTVSETDEGGPRVVPSLAAGWSHHWRWGGPMLLALNAPRWSHAAGGRHSGA
jgi:hypothetical protein